MDAWVKYRDGDYVGAVNNGKRYLNLYPTSDDAAYAQYIVGLAYYRQIPDITRDQTASRDTIQAMTDLVNHYPKSQYVPDAQEKIRFARDQLAGKDMQVGRYYQERKEYLAAINRYRDVVENYSNTRQIEEALARLVECYYALGLTNEAQTAAAVLGHNYPDSKWYKDSYDAPEVEGSEAPARMPGPGWSRRRASWSEPPDPARRMPEHVDRAVDRRRLSGSCRFQTALFCPMTFYRCESASGASGVRSEPPG